MEDFKNIIYTLPLSEKAYIQWFHDHGVTSWGFSFVVKRFLGGSFEVVFLKVQPKNQLHQSLPVCVRHSVCRIPPQTHHIRISGNWAHESGCLTSLTDDSAAHCILRVIDLRQAALGKQTCVEEWEAGWENSCEWEVRYSVWNTEGWLYGGCWHARSTGFN